MPIVPIDNLGQFGIISSMPPNDVAPNAFYSGKNVRFSPNGVETLFAYSDQMTFVATTGAYSVGYWVNDAGRFWVSGSLAKIVIHDGVSSYEIGNGYAAVVETRWQFLSFNGVFIANNGVDAPQFWDGKDTSTGNMVDLPNWPSGDKCQILRQYKEYLIAMDITSGGVRHEKRLAWSHPAEPGTVPESWDVGDDTKDAGAMDVGVTPGAMREGVVLGEIFVIYKEDSIHGMQYVGPPLIMRRYVIIEQFGALGTNCVCPFPGGHFVITKDDCIIHDGSGQWKSVVSNRLRKEIFQRITEANHHYVFAALQAAYNEVWVCIPGLVANGDGAYPCVTAYMWNWETGAWGVRDLNNVTSADRGLLRPATNPDLWSSDSEQWDSYTNSWDQVSDLDVDSPWVVMSSPATTTLMAMDIFSPSVPIPKAMVERPDLAVEGQKRDGTLKVDQTTRKLVTSFWPRFIWEGPDKQNPVMQITPLVRNSLNVPYTPCEAQTLSAETLRADFYDVNSVYFGFNIQVDIPTTLPAKLILQGYDIDIKQAGKQIP